MTYISTAPNWPDRLTTIVLEGQRLREQGRTVVKESKDTIIETFKTKAHSLKEKTHLATQKVMDTFNPEFVYGKKPLTEKEIVEEAEKLITTITPTEHRTQGYEYRDRTREEALTRAIGIIKKEEAQKNMKRKGVNPVKKRKNKSGAF